MNETNYAEVNCLLPAIQLQRIEKNSLLYPKTQL